MSKFTSHLPTEIETLLSALPKGSTVHGITLDVESKQIVILWENQNLESGLTIPVSYELADLSKKRLPRGVLKHRNPLAAVLPKPEPKNAPYPLLDRLEPMRYMSEDEVKESITLKRPVEFMGVEPKWRDFDPQSDTYTVGYFYRLKESVDKPQALTVT